jgi:hypothetical protein
MSTSLTDGASSTCRVLPNNPVREAVRFVIAVVHVVVVSYIVDYSYETLINYYYFIFVDFGNTAITNLKQ